MKGTGAGTKFRIFFPMGAQRVQPPPARVESASGEGVILIVYDEQIVRRMAEAALKRLGCRILTADNQEKRFASFRRSLARSTPSCST
jgi:hypothetical protein